MNIFLFLLQRRKTNIMLLTESIMLLYREAFPMSYQVCGLFSNLATLEVFCPMKNARVSKLSTKGWLSRTRGPILLLPSSREEIFCFLAFSRIVLFPSTFPVTDPQIDKISYVVFQPVAKCLNPPFLNRF